MRILALEPYYGGSHRAFLDGWVRHSRHDWTVLGLPAYKWKWRMRHAAVTFARDVAEPVEAGESWDVLLCSDMLNLAEFRGLAPESVRQLPAVAYFHENQLTYPVHEAQERDLHFAFTNITTALAAQQVWFNSGFHRDSFLNAAASFLGRMPDHQSPEVMEAIRAKSIVQYPGIDDFPRRGARRPGPLRILWVARWEFDKNPDDFFAALELLKADDVPFRVSVIGECFEDSPEVFQHARQRFADHIDRWGYQSSRAQYAAALGEADVVVSTANHEFFGISIVESIAAGAFPLLPDRLAYPEVLTVLGADHDPHLYRDGVEPLAEHLRQLATQVGDQHLSITRHLATEAQHRFGWTDRAEQMDRAFISVYQRSSAVPSPVLLEPLMNADRR